MPVFVNRTLNMKSIKAIGFDMDYTLVRYKSEAFEELVHTEVLKKLVTIKNYPKEITKLKFNFEQVIQGLIVDKKRGNLLLVSRYGKVKTAYHGTKLIPYSDQQECYKNKVIDLNSDNFQSMDTNFSVSNGVMYSQLIDLKDQGIGLPDYRTLAEDVKEVIDIAHQDGTLKNEAMANMDKYILPDPEIVKVIERFKRFGKKLIIATNSGWEWTKKLMDYTFNPYLQEHESWQELFDITICLCCKPRFFNTSNTFLKIDPETGFMTNLEGKLINGIYQGGWAGKLEKDLGLDGEEILYLGDHIYGDVLALKKTFNWRTALVLDPLGQELDAIAKSKPIQEEIDILMAKKEALEHSLNHVELKKHEDPDNFKKDDLNKIYAEMDKINSLISELLDDYKKLFNPYWGEMMRAGQEESRFADQVEKYACIYMAKVSDFIDYTPKTYFRPRKRVMAHEI